MSEIQSQYELNKGLAQMLKGGVIMDVTTPEQARIAEAAGACAVMALERIPADIRAAGGVSRMSDPKMIQGIQEAVSIPVMAKCRIGHFVEAQILEAIEIDYIDESEVLSPADDVYHIDKKQFRVPFVCGARDLGEALRRIREGASMIRTKGEPGTGDVVQAVRHMRKMNAQIREITSLREDELFEKAKELQVPYELVLSVYKEGRPDDAVRCRRCLRRIRHFQIRQSGEAGFCHCTGSNQLYRCVSHRRPFQRSGGGYGRYQ